MGSLHNGPAVLVSFVGGCDEGDGGAKGGSGDNDAALLMMQIAMMAAKKLRLLIREGAHSARQKWG